MSCYFSPIPRLSIFMNVLLFVPKTLYQLSPVIPHQHHRNSTPRIIDILCSLIHRYPVISHQDLAMYLDRCSSVPHQDRFTLVSSIFCHSLTKTSFPSPSYR